MIFSIIKDNLGNVVGGGSGEHVSAPEGLSVFPVNSEAEMLAALATIKKSPDAELETKIQETLKIMDVEKLQADGALTVSEIAAADLITSKATAAIGTIAAEKELL